MRWWILDNQIVGQAAASGGLPANFIEVDGAEASDRDLVFYDGGTVRLKPERPSPNHVWQGAAWVLPIAVAPAITEDWQGLLLSLRGSEVWGKVWVAQSQPEAGTVAATQRMIAANSAFTLLLTTLTNTHYLPDLQFAIAQLRVAMGAMAQGDFTSSQIAWINQQFDAHGFDFQLA